MATYYVRPDGSNTNTGLGATPDLAWATLTKAAQTCVSGDIIIVAPGTYRETVSPTNDDLTFRGNPSASLFAGVARGKVSISGRDSGNSNFSRAYGVNSSKIVTIENIEIIDVYSAGITSTAAITLTRVKIKCAQAAIYTNSVIVITATECVFIGGYWGAQVAAGTLTLIRSILKGGQSAVYVSTGLPTLNFYHSFIEGGIDAGGGSYITAHGCVFERGALYSTLNTIIVVNYGSLSLLGCVFRKSTFAIYQSGSANANPAVVRNCKFEGLRFGINLGAGGTYTIDRNVFKDCYAAVVLANANRTLTLCKFINLTYIGVNGAITMTTDSCIFDGYYQMVSGGSVVTTNPTYATTGITDGIISVSGAAPISGAKSLMLEGNNSAPAYIQWVPCEAGKAKTVKLKLKRNTANASYRPEFYLGDQSAIATDTTDVQTITLTYTHHATELVPLWICGKVTTTGTDFILIDDIAA